VPFAAALSTHPVSSHATGELIGQVIEEVGSHPDVALLLATPGHAGALEDVAAAVRRLLGPTLLIGATAPALAGQGADEGGGPALGLWAGITGPIQPFQLPGPVPSPGFAVTGAVVIGREGLGREELGREELAQEGAAQAGLLGALSGPPLGARVVGALSNGPLLVDDRRLAAGAVGVVFGPGVRFEAVTATDWRAIGPEMAVTESDPGRELVLELDGVPALERLRRLAADEVPAEEIEWINRRLGIGPAAAPGSPVRIDAGAGPEVGAALDPASSVVEVRGGDRSNGAIAAGPFPTGSRIRFWVGGDPEVGLRRALDGRAADSVLLFAAGPAARGYPPRPGGTPAAGAGPGPADASIVADALRVHRVLGMVAPAQIGPQPGRLGLRRRDVTMALLSNR
jgi:small ligand-binding sensory domain FIST